MLPVVLLAELSLSNVPGSLVPFKQLLQRFCREVKLQTVVLQVLQGQHMGLPIFTICDWETHTDAREKRV